VWQKVKEWLFSRKLSGEQAVRFGVDISPVTAGRTGVGNYVFYLLKNMLSVATDDQFVGFAATLSSLALEGLDAGLKVRHVRLPTRALYAVWRRANLLPIETFVGQVDMFHATNYFVPPARKAKRVVTIHDLSFLIVPQYCSPRIVRPFSSGIGKFARQSDAIIVYSESVKRDIVSRLDVPESKVRVIYLAVDDAFECAKGGADWLEETYDISRPYILFVGMLEPRKNVPAILRAFDAIRSDVPHRLVIVGARGWMYEEIFQLHDELGLGDRVRFLGFVPGHDKLAAFYRNADLFVYPSFYEGFGLPVLEAMKCGCPVVASKAASIVEIAEDAALLVDADDWKALAESMDNALNDDALREELSRKGRERAAVFSWKRAAEQTLDLYREVVGSTR
jgi:glycosyltransferase involved in cell wall biosynthesis